jgi:hypothetical protein
MQQEPTRWNHQSFQRKLEKKQRHRDLSTSKDRAGSGRITRTNGGDAADSLGEHSAIRARGGCHMTLLRVYYSRGAYDRFFCAGQLAYDSCVAL